MSYFTWKLELVSNILQLIVGSQKLLLLMTKYWKFLWLLTLVRLMDMIRCLSWCWNYVTNLLLQPYPYWSIISLIQGFFQTLRRSQILCLFTKKGASWWLIIIDQYSCKSSLLNCMPFVLSRANMSCVLACSHANMSCVLLC